MFFGRRTPVCWRGSNGFNAILSVPLYPTLVGWRGSNGLWLPRHSVCTIVPNIGWRGSNGFHAILSVPVLNIGLVVLFFGLCVETFAMKLEMVCPPRIWSRKFLYTKYPHFGVQVIHPTQRGRIEGETLVDDDCKNASQGRAGSSLT